VAAFLPELAPLRAALGEAMHARVGPLNVAARVVGIGLPMAAVGTAMQVAELRPKAVVAIGSCGAYAGGCATDASCASRALAIGDVAVGRRVCLVDASAGSGLTQFPEPMSTVIEASAALAEGLVRLGGKQADLATTLAITVDDATAARIAQSAGVQTEHLEAFGMAAACAARGIPFANALGVANFVGSRARDEWRAHHRRAASAAADLVFRWLRDGAIPA
jgi:futalosine hydrolase